MNLGIIDVGIGNAKSIANVMTREGLNFKIIKNPSEIQEVEKLILPGVGSFDANISRLDETGFSVAIQEAHQMGMPILGICLGAQMLLTSSEEGKKPGLGFIQGTSKEFVASSEFRVPHMGWNKVKHASHSRLLLNIQEQERFYFAHSFYMTTEDETLSIGTTTYNQSFTSIVQDKNCYGVQFHPEKSHEQGIRILANFAGLND
jgi:glutamine amidotransferase